MADFWDGRKCPLVSILKIKPLSLVGLRPLADELVELD